MIPRRDIERALTIEVPMVRLRRCSPRWAVRVCYPPDFRWVEYNPMSYYMARQFRAWILAERVLLRLGSHDQEVWDRWANYSLRAEWSARKIIDYALNGGKPVEQKSLFEEVTEK